MSKAAIIFGDVHIPGHEDAPIRVLLHAIAWCNPHIVVCCGDLLDYGYFSPYPRTFGQRLSTLEDDVQLAIKLFQAIRAAAPKTNLVFLEGNHEYRLKRWCANNVVGDSLYPSLSPEYRLKAAFPDLVYIPYASSSLSQASFYALNDRFIVVHGWKHGITAIMQHYNMAQGLSIAFGHVHFAGCISKSLSHHSSKLRHAMCVGCLCNLQPPWVPAPTGWAHGFGAVFSGPEGDTPSITTIENGRGVFDGKIGVRTDGYEPVGEKKRFDREQQETAHAALKRVREALAIWDSTQGNHPPRSVLSKPKPILAPVCAWGPH